jgi:hypothetical protein
MTSFRAQLAEQRWDDHRFYHHSLVNQSLHLLSATTFVVSYILLFTDPAIAALLAWTVAMTSRQAGHFFFEPRGYDEINQVTHAYKEDVKVGYNLARKVVFMALWLLSPVPLLISPTLWGLFDPLPGIDGFLRHLGLLWLGLGAGGLAFRTIQLCFVRDPVTAFVWATKIVTDPFSDIRLYYRAPLRLLKGERLEQRSAAAH